MKAVHLPHNWLNSRGMLPALGCKTDSFNVSSMEIFRLKKNWKFYESFKN
jgi:hypothetical protein